MHALQRDRGQRGEGVELPALLGHEQQRGSRAAAMREHAARAHRRPQGQVEQRAARERVGTEPGGLRLVERPLRGTAMSTRRHARRSPGATRRSCASGMHSATCARNVRPMKCVAVSTTCSVCSSARQVARELVERARALLAMRRDPRLIAQPGGQLTGDQPDRPASPRRSTCTATSLTANERRGGTKKKSKTPRSAKRQHRRPAAEAHGDQHHREQEKHYDVGEVEVRQEQRGDRAWSRPQATSVHTYGTGRSNAGNRAFGLADSTCGRPAPAASPRADLDDVDARRRRARARASSGAPHGASRVRAGATDDELRAVVRARVVDDRVRRTARPESIAVCAPRSCASFSDLQDPIAARRWAAAAAPAFRRRPPSIRYRAGWRDARRCARRDRQPRPGPTQQRSEASVFQTRSIAWSDRYACTSSSTRSAVRRSASSRSAIRLPLRKKFARGALDLLGHVDLARL